AGTILFQTTGTTDFVHSFYEQHKNVKEEEQEQAIFKHAGQSFIPPALRECSLQEISSSQSLIQPGDIKGIIHSHSTWSDGKNTIKEMALAAREMGLEYLVISDHSKSAGY